MAAPVATRPNLRNSPQRAVRRLKDLWNARQLLENLVRKELKVRYKSSALGFLWALLTPILMTAIFTTIFSQVLRIPIVNFASFFLAGFLLWQFFANSVQASVGAIVSNGPLIKKVYFPREVIPLSIVGAQAFHLLLAFAVTSPLFFYERGNVLPHVPAVLLAIVLLVLFTAGVSMIFAAANVGFRDLEELTQTIFMAWFYATPIIYPVSLLRDPEVHPIFLFLSRANPMTWFVELVRTPLYGIVVQMGLPPPEGAGVYAPPGWPAATTIIGCIVIAVITFAVGYWLFNRLAVTFAKEI